MTKQAEHITLYNITQTIGDNMQVGDLVKHPHTKQLGVVVDIRDVSKNYIHPYKVRWITTPPLGHPRSSKCGWYNSVGLEAMCK